MMGVLEEGLGLEIVLWFNSWPGFLRYALAPLAAVGSELGIMVAVAVVYWSIDMRAGRRLLLVVLGSQIVSMVAKVAFARPRPFQVAPNRIDPLSGPEGFGIPSGHTVFGTVSGLWLADTVRRRWVTVVAVVYIVLMGLSRMVHGVHYPQDVLLGWILGILFFFIYRAVERAAARRGMPALWAISPSRSVPLVLLSAAALFVVVLLLHGSFEERKGVLSVVGGLSGALIGFMVDSRRLRFSSDGPIGRRALRLLLGLPVLGALHFGLAAAYYGAIGEATGAGALLLYLFRYALLGVALAVAVPWLFRILALAPVKRDEP